MKVSLCQNQIQDNLVEKERLISRQEFIIRKENHQGIEIILSSQDKTSLLRMDLIEARQ